MGRRTGLPKGRPPGVRNKRRRDVEIAELARVVEDSLPEAFHGDAHAYLMSVYKDPWLDRRLRIDAAGKAIKYEKPALQSIERSGPNGRPIPVATTSMSLEEFEACAARLLEEI
jgi:hypothetical protein